MPIPSTAAQIEKNGGNGAKSLLLLPSPPLSIQPPPPSSLHQKYPPPPPRFPTTGAGGSLRKKGEGVHGERVKIGAQWNLLRFGGGFVRSDATLEIKTRTTPAPIPPPSALPEIKRKEEESGFFFFERFSGKEGTAGVPELRRSHKFSPPPISLPPLLRPPCLKRVGVGGFECEIFNSHYFIFLSWKNVGWVDGEQRSFVFPKIQCAPCTRRETLSTHKVSKKGLLPASEEKPCDLGLCYLPGGGAAGCKGFWP